MSWLPLAFVLAIASASVYCGTVSKPMRYFRKPIKHLYLDFDETISTDALSKFVRNKYCKLAGWKLEACTSKTMPKDRMAMVDALKSEKKEGRPNVTESMTGNGKDGYRNDDRIPAMANFINDVRTLLDGNVFIVSTSWYPVNEEQWQAYLKYISDETGLGFPLENIFAVADPGPGLSADKGAVIKANMAKHGIMFDEALFADDSAGNIKSARGVCNTLHLSKRAGMDDTDRDYITYVASLPEFRRRPKPMGRPMGRSMDRVIMKDAPRKMDRKVKPKGRYVKKNRTQGL